MNETRPVVIIHFNPIELYPPVINLIKLIEGKGNGKKYMLFTTHLGNSVIPKYGGNNGRVKIIRKGLSTKSPYRIYRWLSYLNFHISTLVCLLRLRPGSILYYETLSSLPVFLYLQLFRRNTKLFIK
jgi:hypothetical protein